MIKSKILVLTLLIMLPISISVIVNINWIDPEYISTPCFIGFAYIYNFYFSFVVIIILFLICITSLFLLITYWTPLRIEANKRSNKSLIVWIPNVLHTLLITPFRYLIYKRYKFLGRYINNTIFNPLITFVLLWIMFIYDNFILYTNIIEKYRIYGISFDFLLHLELKAFSIFIFNMIYSLIIGYLLKHLSFRCFVNSDFSYQFVKNNTVQYCYVLFPFKMFGFTDSIYYRSVDIIKAYMFRNYKQFHKKYFGKTFHKIWILELLFMWPHCYFPKIVYNIIKQNSKIYDRKYDNHAIPSYLKFLIKSLSETSFQTWVAIYLQFIFIFIVLYCSNYYITLFIYIYLKSKILLKYGRRFKEYYYKDTTHRSSPFYGGFWFELQKLLWRDYKFLGFFISKGKVYTNGPTPSNIFPNVNKLRFFKVNNVKWVYHSFGNNNWHVAWIRNQYINGLTTSNKHGNLILPTNKPLLYPINYLNIEEFMKYGNRQYWYCVPMGVGKYSDQDPYVPEYFGALEEDHQMAIIKDAFMAVDNNIDNIPDDWF